MQGQAVYRQAVARRSEDALDIMSTVGWTAEDVDWFVGHQANQRILDAVSKRIGVAPGRAISNVARVGNTASASIPLALSEAHAAGKISKGDLVLLAATGGGFTAGSALLRWEQ